MHERLPVERGFSDAVREHARRLRVILTVATVVGLTGIVGLLAYEYPEGFIFWVIIWPGVPLLLETLARREFRKRLSREMVELESLYGFKPMLFRQTRLSREELYLKLGRPRGPIIIDSIVLVATAVIGAMSVAGIIAREHMLTAILVTAVFTGVIIALYREVREGLKKLYGPHEF